MFDSLQALCEDGQRQLMQMDYLRAEGVLARAEAIAWGQRDWDSLARLYMPLQECRRQRRQRCGEGVVCLDLLATGPGDVLSSEKIIAQMPHGQLLIAGWGSLAPAVEFRRLQAQQGIYAETFLGAVFPVSRPEEGRAIVIAPTGDVVLPEPRERSIETLRALVPPDCVVIAAGELPSGRQAGDHQTYGIVMGLWERLHGPYLKFADAQADPVEKIKGYRQAIEVDYGCELAHQKLSDSAHELARQGARPIRSNAMTYYGGGYNNGPRLGTSITWVIGAVIILFGLIRYMGHTQVNPVTGEKQHLSMSPQQEEAMGLQAAPQMAAQMGGEADPRTDAGAGEVARIGEMLAARSDAGRSPYSGNFRYHLLNDPRTVNAFALPGGQIFITRALLVRLDNEAELAGVLGHETGHVICRHSAQQMEAGKLGQMITMGVAVGSSSDRNGYAASLGAQMANQMLQLHYSRDDESQADEFGMRYMAQAGFDPAQMQGVMEVLRRLEAESPGGTPEMLRTHPLATTRIQRVKDLLERNDYSNGGQIRFTSGAKLRNGVPAGAGNDAW